LYLFVAYSSKKIEFKNNLKAVKNEKLLRIVSQILVINFFLEESGNKC
jgi:hypothetical protein